MFTQQEFFQMFADYNASIGFIPWLAYALGFAVLAGLLSPRLRMQRAVWVILAGLWLWTGSAYFYMVLGGHVAPLRIFGLLFLIQGGALLGFSVLEQYEVRRVSAGQKTLGTLLALTALVFYPLIGAAAGHVYPAAPSFGITPCPLVIFTFACFLLSPVQIRAWFYVVPSIWALFGSSAIVLLGMPQDILLPLAAAAGWLASGLLGQHAPRVSTPPIQPGLAGQH
jgi:hypothetical protein